MLIRPINNAKRQLKLVVFRVHLIYSVGPIRGSIFGATLDPISGVGPIFMESIVEASILSQLHIEKSTNV